eukprot:1157154-Pelagomonas_calceolata.AAC.4
MEAGVTFSTKEGAGCTIIPLALPLIGCKTMEAGETLPTNEWKGGTHSLLWVFLWLAASQNRHNQRAVRSARFQRMHKERRNE